MIKTQPILSIGRLGFLLISLKNDNASAHHVACDLARLSFAEEKGNAPNARKRDDGIYDAAEKCLLAAEEPRDDIELEKTDTAPVEAADDGEDECDSVKHKGT